MSFRKLSNATATDLIKFHRALLADRARTETYRAAIEAVVKRGDVVADLGCGTGILSFFAARAGAKHVYAIDEGPVVELARALARDNGLADRITFLNAPSFDVTLDEKAGVIVTETMGNNGLDEHIVCAVDDARRRWLGDGGVIVPRAIEVIVAPVDLPRLHDDMSFWSEAQYGVDFSRMRELTMNAFYAIDVAPESFAAAPAVAARVDLHADNSGSVRATAQLHATRDALISGVAVWFRAELADGITITNAPPNECASWKQSFFPIASRMRVARGDAIAIDIHTFNGVEWRWSIATSAARAEQSTMHGFPLLKPR
jgi:enediyne biosynthesis protein CalE3